MTSIKLLLTVGVVGLLLVGCSPHFKEPVHEKPADELYKTAQKKLRGGNWKQAIAQLEKLDNSYPFSSCSQQVQLDLIYVYYKNSDLSLALEACNRFMRLYPTYRNIDYVMYMSGLTKMALDDNVLQRFFGVDRSNKNPHYARSAFNDFSKLIRSYPDSRYVSDASKRMVFLKDRLAQYEYSVASYYTRRSAWIAVVNRIERMLRDYPDTQSTRSGLKLMENAYRQMQMNIQADKVAKIISANDIKP